jgi:hypothetical protein
MVTLKADALTPLARAPSRKPSGVPAPALARLAFRFDATVVPVLVLRVKGARFRLIAEARLALPRSGNSVADTLALMIKVNDMRPWSDGCASTPNNGSGCITAGRISWPLPSGAT